MIEYIDTHAHLPMLEHDTREQILQRARQAGVGRMVTVSTDETNWQSSQQAALADPKVYYSVGMHPHDASRWNDHKAELDAYFPGGKPAEKLVAIGELGLDFHYSKSPHDVQIACLEEQLALARRYELPVIIHCRDAFQELFDTIKRVGMSKRGGVMHCFTGKTPDAKAALDLGLYISFSGIVTFKTAGDLREAAKVVPQDRMVIETDCPFLAPIPMRGKPNEPSYLPHTAQVLAATTGRTLEAVAKQTAENAVVLFGLSAYGV